ncbi:MAG: 30S ribosomal protein S21 [Dehalococcoidia bacterium]|nr:30S ribosomal protein S21 [Dehalococcoidia bacterium]
MSLVTLQEGESQEGLLNRFKKIIQRDGVLRELKARRYFVSKQEKARAKARKAAKRMRSKRPSY